MMMNFFIGDDLNKKKKKKIKKRKKKEEIIKLSNVELILIIFIGFVLGSGITLMFIKPIKFDNYEKVDSNVESIIENYNYIIDNYYEELDKNEIANGAIKGMLNAIGDPYTTYMDTTTYNNFNITLKGQYEGLGIEISKQNDDIIVVGMFEDSPAKEAGLQLGDILISIDGINASDITTAEFSKYVRESKNNTFKVIAKRNEETLEFNIAKKVITLNSVTSHVIEKENKKIGYIYMSIFANNSYDQFKNNLESLEKENIDSLIIDLRDNTGGELETAKEILSLFMKNDKVIYQMELRDGKIEKTYSTGKKDKTYPIVILVNGNTASASEVMTASLKENLGATVIGETTYGKGTAQTVLKLSSGDQFKMTTKKWLTPNGNWINEVGIIPDIEIKLSSGTDSQLEKAIEYILNR